MDQPRLERLTEKQRACLRLVQRHYTSKEIARELGIGVDAVDQRIKTAMKTLGVSRRADAARILAPWETPSDSNRRDAPSQRPFRRLRLSGFKPRQLRFITKRGRFVFWCCVAGIIFGYLEAGAPLDDLLRDWNNSTHRHSASGDITVVAIDQETLAYFGMRWTRQHEAQLIRALDRAQAKRLAIARLYDVESTPDADRALATELQRLNPAPILGVAEELGENGQRIPRLPLPEFRRHADLANPGAIVRLWSVRELPFAVPIGGRRYPSVAVALAHWPNDDAMSPVMKWASALTYSPNDPRLIVDFSIDPRTIPTISAIDVLRGKADSRKIFAKDVVIAQTDVPDTSGYAAPGYGIIPAVYTHVLGAETLKAGMPVEVPWICTFLPVLLVVLLCTKLRRPLVSASVIAATGVGLLILPAILDRHMIFIQITTPLFFLGLVGTGFTCAYVRRQRRAKRYPLG